MSKFSKALTLTAAAALFGCGGTGGDTQSPPAVAEGQVLASFVKGVFVCQPDDAYCVQTNSEGYFSIPTEQNAYLKLNLLKSDGGYAPVGYFPVKGNFTLVYPTDLARGNKTVGAVLRTFFHALAGDFNNTLIYLDLSKVKVISLEDGAGAPLVRPLADHLLEGKNATARVLLSNGTEAGFYLSPSDRSVEVCFENGNCRKLSATTYRWLVLVYMMADNNLSAYADLNLEQMQRVFYPPQIKVVALKDGYGDGGIELLISRDGGEGMERTELPEADSADAEYLKSFVLNQVASYPADRVALIIWNHGLAWLSPELKPRASVKLAGTDETDGSTLYLHRLAEALKTLKGEGVEVSLLGFDECLMSYAEVVYAAVQNAKVVVASEYLESALGWNYTLVFEKLAALPEADAPQFAKMIVDAFGEFYGKNPGYCVNGICTLGALSVQNASLIVEEVNRIAAYYLENYAADPTLREAFLAARNASGPIDPDTQIAQNSVDLYLFASSLNASLGLDAADRLKELIKNSIYLYSSDGRYNGLAIYFPLAPSDDGGWAELYYNCTPQSPCSLSDDPNYYNPFGNQTWAEFIKVFVNQ